ncbi:tRNA (adenosine(37)-N6)-threonylcarbamoyltransferase complex ATPase subunit type 1 TsaE [Candidatus Protochlamydia phocaeensis]|uniref:tRNA (adenosine(37)-N6)-threonylcarbamoyltransferase complex ATPase subunit type 1 TsaE n=1 Tax=Candidatus Protochlamydia phocaeensis TaxID=1414722 RepID=UPI000838685A|nr:tRNA (adenosine(37)-N6)-threonylcarbamoyltransferase complex ATPase subunit type 1 TsaE [Candidatus Protochlamydia phocaeensis]
MKQYFSHSAEETFLLGHAFGKQLPLHSVICFFGDLAAGKTTFIKGLVAGAGQLDPSIVQSPTFTYLNIYEGVKTIYHFDLYRLSDADEFLSMGFEEYFEANGICCIEWSERIAPILPLHCIHVTLAHQGGDERMIIILKEGEYEKGCSG